MSIIEILSGSQLMDLSAMATRSDFPVIKDLIPSVSTGFEGCPDVLKVFANESGDYLENDFTSFLIDAGVFNVTFILQKDCEDLVHLDDDTYGTFYAKGYWKVPNGFSVQQEYYTGFKLDWQKIINAFGVGNYNIVISAIFHEIEISFCSCNFYLQQYSDENADRTCRIRTIQNGDILDSFDYTDMNWEQSWRLPGFFGYPQDKLEVDNYLDINRDITQIQDKLYKEYTLQTDFIAECFKYIFDDILLSNEIFIDDYNIKNAYDLKNTDVIPSDSTSEYFVLSDETFKEITFESRSRKKVKRNVK